MRITYILPSMALAIIVSSSRVISSRWTCPQTTNSNVTITSGATKYVLSVPADVTQFNVVGPEQDLGCVGPLGSKYARCTDCTSPASALEISTGAGICSFNVSGHATLLYHSHNYGLLKLNPPGQILTVECGLSLADVPTEAHFQGNRVRQVDAEHLAGCASNLTITLKNANYAHVAHVDKWMDPYWDSSFGLNPLSCRSQQEGSTQCFDCGDNYTSITVNDPELGACQFYTVAQWKSKNFTSIFLAATDGEHKFDSPAGIALISCGEFMVHPRHIPKLREPKGPAVQEDTGVSCDVKNGFLNLFTHSAAWFVNPPADQQAYDLAAGELGCLDTGNPLTCAYCNLAYTAVKVDTSLGVCYISTNNQLPLRISASQGIVEFDTATSVTTVQCGFPETSIAPRDAEIETRDMSVPQSPDPNCAAGPHKVAINTADGNTYFPAVPLDLKGHPMTETFCVRATDAACVPCSQVGPAVGVSTQIKWGPCIFFTEDHRQFFTQYWDESPIIGSTMTPITPIFPSNVISMIECGSA